MHVLDKYMFVKPRIYAIVCFVDILYYNNHGLFNNTIANCKTHNII